eukprot:350500-Chlamydomonas_euryale.AAC.25
MASQSLVAAGHHAAVPREGCFHAKAANMPTLEHSPPLLPTCLPLSSHSSISSTIVHFMLEFMPLVPAGCSCMDIPA